MLLHEAVFTFLKGHPAYICAECLASRLELPLPQTVMVTLWAYSSRSIRLRRRRTFARCAVAVLA